MDNILESINRDPLAKYFYYRHCSTDISTFIFFCKWLRMLDEDLVNGTRTGLFVIGDSGTGKTAFASKVIGLFVNKRVVKITSTELQNSYEMKRYKDCLIMVDDFTTKEKTKRDIAFLLEPIRYNIETGSTNVLMLTANDRNIDLNSTQGQGFEERLIHIYSTHQYEVDYPVIDSAAVYNFKVWIRDNIKSACPSSMPFIAKETYQIVKEAIEESKNNFRISDFDFRLKCVDKDKTPIDTIYDRYKVLCEEYDCEALTQRQMMITYKSAFKQLSKEYMWKTIDGKEKKITCYARDPKAVREDRESKRRQTK